jgi:hypothetical protein
LFFVAKLSAETRLRAEAIMINFLECGFFGRSLGVVFVRRITRPATGVRVELTDK